MLPPTRIVLTKRALESLRFAGEAFARVERVIPGVHTNFEVGVHPGYNTFHSRESLARETQRLKRSLGEDYPGGRQHYLRWSPQTWLDWEACGLRYDSSIGFASHFGFRAGTAY